ncbi:MAG TPA: TonB-dependent receptor, partial [Candidatus Marinimicrobia bacterium]|nr:TonB-dependent receptor [Candidatus Neomarinimicrobiota bacterium]
MVSIIKLFLALTRSLIMGKKNLFLVIFSTCSILFAGVTGKLVGTVTDASTGEALIGVNVVLKGTVLGAASDKNGDYFILNISAGSYTASASYIGYKTTSVTDVRMNADRTTTVNFALEISAVEGEEVIVEAERPVIVRDQTATTVTIEKEDFENMPINSYADIIDNVAGVIENDNGGGDDGIHVRGGRSGETAYLVDGFYVKDIINGGMATDVARGGISELSIITGSFDAEYGQAMSGIINIITREGGADYDLSFRTSTDQFGEKNNWNTGRIEGTASGPIIPTMPNLATFFISADRKRTDGRLKNNFLPRAVLKVDEDGDGVYDAGESWTDVANGQYDIGEGFTDANGNDMWDHAVYDSSGDLISAAESWTDAANGVYDVGEVFADADGDGVFDGDVYALADIDGDGIAEPLKKGAKEITGTYNWTDRLMGKLVLRPINNLKITLGTNIQNYENRGFSMNYRQLPERSAVSWQESKLMYGRLNYTFSENMFVTLSYSKNRVENWTGPKVPGESFLNDNHELYSDIFTIPDDWDKSILDPGSEFKWLSYYAEPYNDSNEDGAYTDGEDEYEDMNGDGQYSWGVFVNLREGDAYDNTSNYEFYGSYPIVNNSGDTIRMGYSTYHSYYNDYSETVQYEGALTWQVNKVHQIKSGFTQKNHKLFNFSAISVGGGYYGVSSDPSFILWEKEPVESSFYIRDKMEFSDLVINIGLRYDILDPKSEYADPTENIGFRYDGEVLETSDLNSIDFDAFAAGNVEWGYIDEDGSFRPPDKASVKAQWSPRIGMGYPVTENTAFHFSYGHFFKYPDYDNMYDYTNSGGIGGEGVPSGLAGLGSNNIFNLTGNSMYPFPFNLGDWYIPPVGSPNIKPERAIQYEFGLRTMLTPEYLMTLTLFYNDRHDYISANIYDADPSEYAIYENMDYANSKGFELGLRKLFTQNFSWEVFYSYSRAEGNTNNETSNWYAAYLSSVYGTHPVHRTITMAWDQPHTLNVRFDYQHPKGFGLNVLGNMGSGLPYTPTDARGRYIADENSGRMPYTAIFDAKVYYDLKIQ